MVKLGGPAMSLEASGTIGNVLTFSKWKGRPYVRSRVVPANPKSDAQFGVRAMMKFLAQAWAALGASPQASWDLAAEARKISAFNAYQSANMKNWRDYLAPGKTNTLLRTTNAAAITATATVESGRYGYSEITVGAGAGQWGAIVYLSPITGFSPAWNNARMIVPAAPGGDTPVFIGPLASGTYFLRFHTFSVDGKWDQTYVTEDTFTIV
jgi:hypothetical protein